GDHRRQGQLHPSCIVVLAVDARRLLHYMEGRLPEEEALFDAFELMVRNYGPDPMIGVNGLWDEHHEPKSLDQWKTVYRSLVAHHWPNATNALWWAWDLSERLARSYAQVHGLEEKLVAHRVLDGPLDLQLKYH